MSKIVYHNATFHTLDEARPVAKAILTENGTILDILEEIPQESDIQDAQWVDLAKAHVYPGFTDAHTHSFEGGLYSLGADLSNATSLDEVLQLLTETKPVSGMIFASGFDENSIAEKRFPAVEELDRVSRDYSILLRRVDGHSCALNTLAFERIEWRGKLPEEWQNPVRKHWNDLAAHWFHRNLDEEGILRAYQQASQIALKAGCTSIHTMVGDSFQDPLHYSLLASHVQDFPVEFILYPQMFDIEKAVELGSKRIGGCILVDGSFGSHTAGLKKPYADQAGKRGTLYRSDTFWQAFYREASENNLQVFVHAIGDAAIQQIVDAVKMLGKTRANELHHTIIHCELTSDRMLDDMAEYGIHAAMQPVFDHLWGGKDQLYEEVLGEVRTKRTNRLKSMVDRGILVAGSTDWYITELNMLRGIHSAIHHNNPDERLSAEEAVRLFTVNPAKMIGEDQRLGMLKAGMQVDMVCLGEAIEGSIDISSIDVLQVIKRSEIVYSNND